jgi:hypothetical protein
MFIWFITLKNSILFHGYNIMPDEEEKELHIFYIIAFVLLIISYLWHLYIYENTHLPDHENPPKKRNYNTYVNTMHSSMIKAFIFGVITSNAGFTTGIQNAVAYGLVSPLLMYIGY